MNRLVFETVHSKDDTRDISTYYYYDNADRLIEKGIRAADGELFSYNRTYDVGGRLTGVSGGGASASYTYDNVGRPLTSSADNGVENSLQYDLSGHVIQAGNSLNGLAFQTQNYTYDMSGRQSSFESNTGRQTSYAYDGAGRLTNENSVADSRAYGYDSRSNRVTLEKGQEQLGYTYNLADGLVSEGNIEYTYDDNGNTLFTVDNASQITYYVYDVRDRLTSVSNNDFDAFYTYYPDGMRKSKTVNGEETIYIWDGSRLLAEMTDSGTTYYLWGLRLVAGIKGNNTEYYHHDGHGNVTAVTDENGAVLKSYEYDAFGVELNEDASDGNPFRYCGAYYDKDTGLYYLINRYYDPTLGRFTQRDPAKDGANWYIYCYNNPLSYIDPFGLATATDWEYAKMCQLSYKDLKKDYVMDNWKVGEVYHGSSSLKVVVFIPAQEDYADMSECILCFRGTMTNFSWESAKTMWNDVLAKYSNVSPDAWDAIEFVTNFAAEHPGVDMSVTGHSKGGGEAIIVAALLNIEATTFNAANFNFELYGIKPPKDKSKIRNFYVDGELLHKLIGFAEYGTTIMLPTQYWMDEVTIDGNKIKVPSPMENHSMNAVMSAVSSKGSMNAVINGIK